MSLYADYITERTGDLILEFEHGFATYRYLDGGKTVYIVDIYVAPAARKGGTAAHMANVIAAEARSKGCTEMLGTVSPSANNAHTSLLVLIAYGMTLKSAGNDVLVFRKDI